MDKLKEKWPFTEPKQGVEKALNAWGEPEGWCHGCNRRMFRRLLGPDTKLVVDGGSWKGQSAWILAKTAPNAMIVCVDTWDGSHEHKKCMPDHLPGLYDTFLTNLAEYRDRIIPIRADWEVGLSEIAACDLVPDLIYVDWQHDEPSVTAQLEFITATFPKSKLVGDDWTWPGVRRAVENFAHRNGKQIIADYSCWEIIAINARGNKQ